MEPDYSTEPPEERAESVSLWLRYAQGDLDVAGRSLQPPQWAELAFHLSQQAAEKALKAYLVFLGCPRPPFTHKLERLVHLVVDLGGEALPQQMVEVLDAFPPDVRYPEVVPPSEDQARLALAMAQEVYSFIRRAIGLQEPQ